MSTHHPHHLSNSGAFNFISSTDKQHDFRYGNLVFVNLTVEQNDFRFFSFGLCQFSKWAWFKVLEPWSLSIWWMNNMILGIGALVFVNQMDEQHDFRYGSLVAQWLTLACWPRGYLCKPSLRYNFFPVIWAPGSNQAKMGTRRFPEKSKWPSHHPSSVDLFRTLTLAAYTHSCRGLRSFTVFLFDVD